MEEMEFEDVGKSGKYYHKSCFEEYAKDKEFQEKENAERKKMHEYIAEIYNIPIESFPRAIFPELENIRNGEEIFKGSKKTIKRKQGYSYNTIRMTYKYCRGQLEYWNEAKDFDSITIAMRYGMRIIMDKISYIDKKVKESEEVRAYSESKSDINKQSEFVSNFKKTESKRDISKFLD